MRTGSSYPGRSSLRDDPAGIFFGILQSRGRRKPLSDRRTSSRSRLRKYPGHILEADTGSTHSNYRAKNAQDQSRSGFIFFVLVEACSNSLILIGRKGNKVLLFTMYLPLNINSPLTSNVTAAVTPSELIANSHKLG